MKNIVKAFVIFSWFALMLVSCNLPAEQPFIDTTQLALIVEKTLTAQAIIDLSGELNAHTLEVGSATNEYLVQSITPAQTATLTPEVTSTLTPTPTTSAGDPKQTLGSPDYQNTLENGSAFGLDETGYQDDYTKIVIKNDAMVLSSSSTTGFRGWRLTSKAPQDIYLEGIFTTQACSGADLYGLVLRAPDYSSGYGYYVGITCDGLYQFSKWDDNGTYVFPPASHPSIKTGANQTNRLGIWAQGPSFKLYVNGTMVQEYNVSSLTGTGHFGVFIAGQGSGSFVVQLDEIAYWSLP